MTKLLSIARRILAKLFRSPAQRQEEDLPIAQPGHNSRPRKPKAVKEQTVGEFYFREAILDQLGDYFKYLRRMKQGDREAYSLYQKIGAHIIPYQYPNPSGGKLPRWWAQEQPAFGAVAFAVGDEWREIESKDKITCPRFLYFSKYKASKRPGTIERFGGGSVYVLTVYWDTGTKRGRAPTEYAVGVEPDGTVHVLRTLNASFERPKARGKNRRRGKVEAIPVRRWGINPYWDEFVAKPTAMGETTEQFMTNLFCWVAELFERANASMTRVSASKDGMKAVFSVAIERTPYFFRDREREGEQRKKIFHIVRAHQRELTGKSATVRTHFRGERQFEWNGYQVEITVPGWHHFDMMEFNVGGHDAPADKPLAPGVLGASEIGEFLNDAMTNGNGGEYARRRGGTPIH